MILAREWLWSTFANDNGGGVPLLMAMVHHIRAGSSGHQKVEQSFL